MRLFSKGKISIAIVTTVLLVDQLIKIWVKTNMRRGESIRIADWFYIYFTENNGMAFGMEFINKLFLSSFRIVVVCFIIYLTYKAVRRNLPTGLIVCLSLIIAGALGNIVDSLIYGQIFSESNFSEVATLVPWGSGYAPMLYGKVVDMFYFPLVEFNWPGWMPFIGGEHFIFFSPIFNFADAAISCGIIALLIFYNKYLSSNTLQTGVEEEESKEQGEQPHETTN